MNSLYIHIPFCAQKCFYCSFAIIVGQTNKIDLFLDCLNKEAEKYKNDNNFSRLDSIYLGGGTPSSIDNKQIDKLFFIIKNNFDCSCVKEFTFECNPEDIDVEKARLIKSLGVNRVSLGVQTLNNKYLKFLGRKHNNADAINAFKNLRKVGFDNISVDLMFGFPKQTNEEIENDINEIINLEPEHLSIYSLTVEPYSRFFVQRMQLPDNEIQREQYIFVIDKLEKCGFKQYEISNFAKTNKKSLHNMNYWLAGNYIGLGLAAHSHINGQRFWNVSRFNDYIRLIESGKSAVDGEEMLNNHERLIEAILFGLRMNDGVNILEFQKRFRCDLSEDKKELIENLTYEKMFCVDGEKIKTTLQGRLLLDEISSKLI